MHSPKKSGWMETRTAAIGRGFPGLRGDHRRSSFHASRAALDNSDVLKCQRHCLIVRNERDDSG